MKCRTCFLSLIYCLFYLDEMSGTDQTSKEMAHDNEETAAKFGKLFEKASSISKPKTEKSKGDYSDCFIDKFKSRLKPKQTVLPSGLSKVVSLHKEKYGESDYEAESYDKDVASFGGKNNKTAEIDEFDDEFDNDFEKEFQKAIVERSTYTEWKRNESNNSNSAKKDVKATSEIKSNLDEKELDLSTVKGKSDNKSSDDIVYEFESEKADRESTVKFARGKRTRVSRVKSDTNKGKTKITDPGEADIVSDTGNRESEGMNGIETSDNDDDDNDGDSGKRKRKRKTEGDANRKPAKRRKTATGGPAEVC